MFDRRKILAAIGGLALRNEKAYVLKLTSRSRAATAVAAATLLLFLWTFLARE